VTRFESVALREIARPDYADVALVPVPAHASTDAQRWAEAVFDLRSMPRWVVALLSVRQVAVRLIGLAPAPRDVFAVRAVQDDEALISFDDRHLDFRVGVGVDPVQHLLRVVTVVRLRGWRGRVYWAPVSLLHPVVVRAMMRGALRTMARAG
jgi:hypothetical protein